MKTIYWYYYISALAIRWIFQTNLGDYVWYKGKKYIVANGVRCNSWRLSGLENGDNGWVPRSDCKKSITPQNAFRSFRSGWRFYMENWYEIWKRKGITDWMRGLDIWPKGR